MVLEIAAKGQGALTAFALQGQKLLRVCCKGMEYGKTYEVYSDNRGVCFTVRGGEELVLDLPASHTSELVLYKEI